MGVIAAVTPLAAVALSVLVVNFRHVFCAFSFPLHLVEHPVAKAYAVYAMIDEVYAVNASLSETERSAPRLPAMRIACQTYWVGGGLAGVAIGAALPAPIKGLEAALCALFTVLTLGRIPLPPPDPLGAAGRCEHGPGPGRHPGRGRVHRAAAVRGPAAGPSRAHRPPIGTAVYVALANAL